MATFNVYDAQGNLTHSLGRRLGVILGSVYVNNAVNPFGSIYDAGLLEGEPFAIAMNAMHQGGSNISISGGTLSWARRNYSSGLPDNSWQGTVMYGRF